MNLETQERTMRNSGLLYQEICQNQAISSDMVQRFAPDLVSILFPGEAPEPFKENAI
jgi:hypothetical protein